MRALITGITGQDGFYLTHHLLELGYDVHGLSRTPHGKAARALGESVTSGPGRLEIHGGGVQDRIHELILDLSPDEVYHLGAPSRVSASFERPIVSMHEIACATLHLLEAAREVPSVKVYHASSSEMFGPLVSGWHDEQSRFDPQSPYAAGKVAAHNAVGVYRRAYGTFASNGILFNHDSPRRPPHFVTRKITRAAAMIKLGLQEDLVLGNVKAARDFGFAGDYVRAMWLMLQQDEPDDFVVATGEANTIWNIVEVAFGLLDLDPQRHVRISEELQRPTDTDLVRGNPSKAGAVLGWKPEVSFEGLIEMMVRADYRSAREA